MKTRKPPGGRTLRTHDPVFKAQAALAAIREDKAIAEPRKQFDVHATQISDWNKPLVECAAQVFDDTLSPEQVNLAPLGAKIRQLALKNDLVESVLTGAGGLRGLKP